MKKLIILSAAIAMFAACSLSSISEPTATPADTASVAVDTTTVAVDTTAKVDTVTVK